jgi:hypothetical protein
MQAVERSFWFMGVEHVRFRDIHGPGIDEARQPAVLDQL